MFVSVGDILKAPGLSETFEYEGPFDMAEMDLAGDIKIKFKLTNAGSRIIVTGNIKASVILECARCLSEFVQDLDIPVQEEFLPEGSPELESEELNWDNLSQFSYFDERLDLYEVVRQNIAAAVPIKPLCDEKCKGVEGTYNNSEGEEGLSGQEEKSIDPRLLPLMNIQQKAEGRNTDNNKNQDPNKGGKQNG